MTEQEVEERRVKRRDQERSLWRRDLILFGSLLILVVAIVLGGIAKFTGDLNEASIKNCVDNNHTRAAQRRSLHRAIDASKQDIRDARSTDPALFPDIPPAKFAKLIKESVEKIHDANEGRREDLAKLDRVACKKRFP